jgi:hypothetical protein
MSILCTAVNQGPGVLFCMPNRTHCIGFSDARSGRTMRLQTQADRLCSVCPTNHGRVGAAEWLVLFFDVGGAHVVPKTK